MSKPYTKHTITHKGKIYGFWKTAEGAVIGEHIRSESNPLKTPYLKTGSPTHAAVLAAIEAARAFVAGEVQS